MPRKITLVVIIGVFFLGGSLAHAQSDFNAGITAPDSKGFPALSFLLDVYGPGGEWIDNLGMEQVTLLEDGQPVTIQDMSIVQPGLDLMIAVNAGPALALRDGEGISREDQIAEVLGYWAGSAPAGADDRYSLLVNAGDSAVDLPDPQALYQAFVAYQPDFRQSEPSAVSLSAAVNMATTLPDTPGRKRAILYITPVPEGANLAALPNLREQAVQSGARVFVWLLANPQDGGSSGAQELAQLAESTGGQMMIFSGSETLPDLEDYLHSLRNSYAIRYTTALRGSGSHTLAAQVNLPEGAITSPEQDFNLAIQAPNPMFVSPPTDILRSSPADSQDPIQELSPLSVPLQTLVEFPDGIERSITRLRLYVDDQLVEERTSPPFDSLDWNLNEITTSGRHTLRVEVQDSLGLSGSSIEVPVDVTVDLPQSDAWQRLLKSPVLPAAAALALAGGSLGAVIYLANRRRYKQANRRGGAERGKEPSAQLPAAPLPQGNNLAGFRGGWPKRGAQPAAQAALIRLGENNEPVSGGPVALIGPEMTLGQDPTQATCVLNDPSVAALHARLRCSPQGVWTIYDHDSVAGTWVNFTPVTAEGVSLEHGDLLHIGRLSFRFNEAAPRRVRKPTLQVYDDPL